MATHNAARFTLENPSALAMDGSNSGVATANAILTLAGLAARSRVRHLYQSHQGLHLHQLHRLTQDVLNQARMSPALDMVHAFVVFAIATT